MASDEQRTSAEAGYEVAPAHRRTEAGECQSCGTPQASFWSTPEGPAVLCRPCATLFGFGCP